MPAPSRTAVVAVVAVAVVAAALLGLFFFSRVLVPLIDQPAADGREPTAAGGIPPLPPALNPRSTPALVPTTAPQPRPPVPIRNLPGAGRSFHDLQNGAVLERRNPQSARTIRSLSWIEDGIADDERAAAEALIYLAATSQEVFDSLTGKAWLNDPDFRRAGAVVVDLEYLASHDSAAALRLLEMPFLRSLRPPDVLAVRALSELAVLHPPGFRRALRHPAISDGITDAEARLVALLNADYVADPSLLDRLLDPAVTLVEERDIVLPAAGDVTLAVIRSRPGSPRSIDLLESAVRAAESLLNEPFPADYVPLFFTAAVPAALSGSHNGSHIAVSTEFDVDDSSPQAGRAGAVIAHEVAHYYWRWSQPWLDEGAAEFTASYLAHQATGAALEPANYPCARTHTIRHLQASSVSAADPAYICNYAVGERFFLDLYQQVGAEVFWTGLRSFYRDVSRHRTHEPTLPGIDRLRRAFANPPGREAAAAGPVVADVVPDVPVVADAIEADVPVEADVIAADVVVADVVAEVIARWYEPRTPAEARAPDARPVVAELPQVAGWVNRAWVSLAQEGRPVSAFAAADAGDWAWLVLDYSHDYAGPPTVLTFEVVEYYEDGFPYRRSPLAIQAHPSYSGGIQWLSIGPGPHQPWAPGRHWVVVNHQGRKVAQVEFEVTP